MSGREAVFITDGVQERQATDTEQRTRSNGHGATDTEQRTRSCGDTATRRSGDTRGHGTRDTATPRCGDAQMGRAKLKSFSASSRHPVSLSAPSPSLHLESK